MSGRVTLTGVLFGALMMSGCEQEALVEARLEAEPPRLDIISGDGQVSAPGTELPKPLVARVTNAQGVALEGRVVSFVVVQGGGSVFAGASISNADGMVQERWTLGPTAGAPQRVEARAVDNETGAKLVYAVFRATAQVGAIPVASVEVSPATITLAPGETAQLTATLRDEDGDVLTGRSITWSSSAAGVATVSSLGRVTAQSAGTATITASSEGKSGTSSVTVSSNPPPPPPPPPSSGEPIFEAGVDVNMFFDNYESYSSGDDLINGTGKYSYLYGGDGAAGFDIVTSSPFAGSKNVRIDFQPSGEVDRALETRSSEIVNNGGDGPEVVVLTLMRRNLGGSYEGKEWVSITPGRLLHHSSRSPMYPASLNQCYYDSGGNPRNSEIPPLRAVVPTWNRDDTNLGGGSGYSYKQNRGWSQWRYSDRTNDGAWHRYTTRFTRGFAYGRGRIEMWADGVKIMEYIGDDPTRCEYGQVYVPTGSRIVPAFQWTGPSAFDWQGGAYLEYDNLRVWSPAQ